MGSRKIACLSYMALYNKLMLKPFLESGHYSEQNEAREKRASFESREMYETAKERLLKLKPILKSEMERFKKIGAPIDEEGRIDMNAFSKIGQYDPKMIAQDAELVKKKEVMFETQNTPETNLAKNIGELLEVTKTILFNRHWFKGNFIALRTTKFDDYSFGIDELIFDTATYKPLAIIDVTTDPRKKDMARKTSKGGRLKYGLAWDKKGFKAKALENLPVFVVQIRNEEVLRLAREIIDKKLSPESEVMEKNILMELKNQCEEYGRVASSQLVRESYREAAEIFTLMLQNLYR